jgi:ABC-type sugar transport system substrate-binding protein
MMTGSRRLFAGLAAAAVAATLVSACSSSSSSSPGNATSAGGSSAGAVTTTSDGLKGKKIVLLAGSNTNPWAGYFNQVFSSMIKAAGGEVDEQLTTDASTQVQLFNQAIQTHPALIATELLDTTATVASIRKASAAKVPVLAFDGPPDPSVNSLVRTVTSNNTQLGTIAAENLVQGMQSAGMKSGNYVILSGLESMILTQQRLKAFAAYMAKYPQYKLLQTTDTGWVPQTATTQAVQLFAKYGNKLNAVYGMSDYLSIPAIQAAQQAGRTPGKDVVIVGGNCFKSGVQAIEAGTYYATATEDPGTLAKQTAQYVIDMFNGKSPAQHTYVDEKQVTKANISSFAAQCSHA